MSNRIIKKLSSLMKTCRQQYNHTYNITMDHFKTFGHDKNCNVRDFSFQRENKRGERFMFSNSVAKEQFNKEEFLGRKSFSSPHKKRGLAESGGGGGGGKKKRKGGGGWGEDGEGFQPKRGEDLGGGLVKVERN